MRYAPPATSCLQWNLAAPSVVCCQDLRSKLPVVHCMLLFVQLFALRASRHCTRHGHSFLVKYRHSKEHPPFDWLVRCSTMGVLLRGYGMIILLCYHFVCSMQPSQEAEPTQHFERNSCSGTKIWVLSCRFAAKKLFIITRCVKPFPVWLTKLLDALQRFFSTSLGIFSFRINKWWNSRFTILWTGNDYSEIVLWFDFTLVGLIESHSVCSP